jgi:hypothetical protein
VFGDIISNRYELRDDNKPLFELIDYSSFGSLCGLAFIPKYIVDTMAYEITKQNRKNPLS